MINPAEKSSVYESPSVDELGLFYNTNGELLDSSKKLTEDNCTISIITRNRCSYLVALINSIDETSSLRIKRQIIANNCEDDTIETVRDNFPHWNLVEIKPSLEDSSGILWLRQHYPEKFDSSFNASNGYSVSNNRGWLQNQIYLNCKTEWVLHWDDDCLVKPGWFEYYKQLQNETNVLSVMNNFTSFAMSKEVMKRIGYSDERFVTPHGAHDNDYFARMMEAKIPLLLGYNRNHDWRCAEDGNPRGNATGNDRFIHLYARSHGHWNPADAQRQSIIKKEFFNTDWFDMKWERVPQDTGIIDRPPFKGYYLKRKINDEPLWH